MPSGEINAREFSHYLSGIFFTVNINIAMDEDRPLYLKE